jgi:hypothetical protein
MCGQTHGPFGLTEVINIIITRHCPTNLSFAVVVVFIVLHISVLAKVAVNPQTTKLKDHNNCMQQNQFLGLVSNERAGPLTLSQISEVEHTLW